MDADIEKIKVQLGTLEDALTRVTSAFTGIGKIDLVNAPEVKVWLGQVRDALDASYDALRRTEHLYLYK